MIPSHTTIDLDIRLFKRYALRLPLAIAIQDRQFKARTTDFSPHGIGMIIDGCPPLKVGVELDIIMHAFGIHEKAKVAWKKELATGLRVGVLRNGPLRGFLSQYRIADVLIGLQRTLKTGMLEVKHGSVVKRVFFRSGNPVFATSSQERDRLGDVLLKKRIITRDQYHRAAEMKKETGKRYAVILVDLGFVKPSQLFAVAKIQVQRIIGSIFLMRDGEFEFTEGPLPMGKVVPLNISLASLIYRQVKRHADVELVREHLLSNIVDFSKTPLNLFQDVRLSRKDRELLAYVDGRTKIQDVITLSRANTTEALKSIFALLEAKILEIRKKNESSSGLTSDEVFSQTKTSPPELIAMIKRMQTDYEMLGYYGVLGLDLFESSEEKIKKAYYQAAKRFHPDRHFGLPEETKMRLTEIFTYITNAYITLSDREQKHEYDKRMKKKTAPGYSAMQDDVDDPHKGIQERMVQNAEIARKKFNKGLEKGWRGLFEDAAHFFAAAIYFDSSVPEYHFHYGRCLVKLQRPKEAVAALNRALEMDRQKADVLAELGHAYIQLGFPLRAQNYFEKALKLHASHKRAAEGLSSLKKQKKG
jgi:curved DNA-binding protein CbpA